MHLRVMRVFSQSAELDFDNHASEREKKWFNNVEKYVEHKWKKEWL